jgi:hypothetical protein
MLKAFALSVLFKRPIRGEHGAALKAIVSATRASFSLSFSSVETALTFSRRFYLSN